jgi:hypothetical protein
VALGRVQPVLGPVDDVVEEIDAAGKQGEQGKASQDQQEIHRRVPVV